MSKGVHVSSKLLLALLISFSVSIRPLPSHAAPDLHEPNSAQLIVKAPLTEDKEALITVTEKVETTPEEIQDLLRDPQAQNADIIVSTDQEKVIEATIRATSSEKDKRLLRFIPLGKLASTKQKIASAFSGYYSRAKNTIMHDRIGLTVLTITVGYDTMIWINSTSFDLQQKTSMVIMNLVMAAAFGLDRDLWTKMTSPLKNRMINVLDRFIVNEKLAKVNVVANQFLANFIFGVGVQATRTGLLSLDNLADVVTTTDFWLQAAKISAFITGTAFAWTEMFGKIDYEKQPVAKMMMKRVSEMRGLILAHLASMSMVLQPAVYGHTPVITYIVHGAIGLLVLSQADRIINFLETNTFINKVYRKIETFENFINNSLQFGPSKKTVISCRSLFAS